MMFMGW